MAALALATLITPRRSSITMNGLDEREGSPLFVDEQLSCVEEKSKYREKLRSRAALPASFDYTRSTRDNYLCHDAEHVGKYSAIRSLLSSCPHEPG